MVQTQNGGKSANFANSFVAVLVTIAALLVLVIIGIKVAAIG